MEPLCVPAGPENAEVILGMMRDYYPIEGVRFRPEVQGPALRGLLSDATLGRAYLVLEAGAVVGYVVLTFDYGLEAGGREIFIDELFIVESCRGRGLGRRVLAFVESTCRELGARALQLVVSSDNERAKMTYERYGFASTRRQMMTLALVD